MCGIVGIVSSNDVNQQIYDSLLLLQHRGQDSTGIATMENTVFHIHKAKGQVNTAYRTRDMRNLLGKIGLGHVRYATKGSAESVEEAQPFYVNAPYGIVLIHNGNLTNTRDLEKQLFNVDINNYNGPLDVLLDLAKAQKVDLEEISITKLADQFHEYITNEKNLNLEIASEYLLMATWLAYLKSKLLLPGTPEENAQTFFEHGKKLTY